MSSELVKSILNSDTLTATVLLKELLTNKWCLTKPIDNKCIIVTSEKDRIVDNEEIKELEDCLTNCTTIALRGIGHTTVLEHYTAFINIILMTYLE